MGVVAGNRGGGRIRRKNVITAMAVIALAALVGAGVLTFCILSAINAFPAPVAEFDRATMTTVTLERSGTWAIFADVDASPASSRCGVSSAAGTPVKVVTPAVREQITRNGRNWTRIATFTTDSPGVVTILCGGTTEGATRYAVAEDMRVGNFVGWLLGGIFGMLVLLGAGIVAGVLIIIRGRRRDDAAKATASLEASVIQRG